MTRQLITSDGSVLPHDATLSSEGVPDGAVLQLVRAHAAPPAPVVHDVTDQVADAAGDGTLRKAARATSAALRHGVVAYSSVSE